jgi:hypothetical protein
VIELLKRTIYNFMQRKISSIQAKVDDQIPKFDLLERHLTHVKLLPNRRVLLEYLPKNGIVAELGVNRGEFSLEIMQACKPEVLHLVDAWGSERYHGGLRTVVENTFEKDIAAGRVQIHQGYSTEMASKFPDGFFDWIYIDTDHSYEVTKAELQAYKHKIKSEGIIAGHDYIQGNWGRILRYGVMEAVHEFCVQEDWELVFLTTEMSNSPSFAIRKIVS